MRRLLIFLVLAALCEPSESDGAQEPWALFPDGLVPGERDGAFGPEAWTNGTASAFGPDQVVHNVSVPVLMPFLLGRAEGGERHTVVIVAPGGGYENLAIDREGRLIAKWLNSLGIAALVLKYRVPRRPWLPWDSAPLVDAQRAVALVRSRAEWLGLHANRIGFMGFSAGGHLSANLVNSRERAYAPVDAADAFSSRPDFLLLIYPVPLVQSDLRTPLWNISSDHPPSFFVQAEDDCYNVENSLSYYFALKRANAPPSELHVYSGGRHGFGSCAVRDNEGRFPVWAPEHPQYATWLPWQQVCTWPERAQPFLRNFSKPPGAYEIGILDAPELLNGVRVPSPARVFYS